MRDKDNITCYKCTNVRYEYKSLVLLPVSVEDVVEETDDSSSPKY